MAETSTPGHGSHGATEEVAPLTVLDLPPGFDGEVPPGPVEAQVPPAMGGAAGASYIAKSLDAMGNVLSSLLGRMASLEQQRSSKSGTPTSDGLEGHLQQLSLAAALVFREGPLLAERPLASAERIMAGTFSSDDSETARRRADEARRVIPGGLMRPQEVNGPLVMGEGWTSGAKRGGATSLGVNTAENSALQNLPPPPPSNLGYFLPPERQNVDGVGLEAVAAETANGTTCLNPAVGTSRTSEACLSMPWGSCPTPGMSFPIPGQSPSFPGSCLPGTGSLSATMGSCLGMPLCRGSTGVTVASSGPCTTIPGRAEGFEGWQHQTQAPHAMDTHLQDTVTGMMSGRPLPPPVSFLPSITMGCGHCVDGVPTEEGQRGFVHVEGQRLPCVCFGGRLVIDMQPPIANQGMSDHMDDKPRPPPGPPPPTPPTTPRTMPRVVTYGAPVATSRTPRGTPVALSPNNIEEASKLVNKLPSLPPVKGTAGGDAAVMAGDWLAQLAPSMATMSPGAAAWWRDLLQEVMGSYTTWLESSPIVRLTLRQKILADVPPLDRFQRVEQRAAMLLLECLPEDLRAEAISTRATSVKGMLFLTLCCYQPGGAGEKHHLQQFLTVPEVASNLDSGVTLARKWIRLFRRGKELQVVLPDPQLLVRGLDRLISKVLAEGKAQSSSTFRIASFKLERQLDYKPTEAGVLDFAQMILGELEAAILALPPTPALKVAAFQETPDGDGNGKGKGKSKSKSKTGAKPCWRWNDGTGCRFGLGCSFAHDPLGPGHCWVCGSTEHMKPQCPYAGAAAGPEQAQGGNQPPFSSRDGPEDGAKAEENGGKGRKPKKKLKKDAVRKAEGSAKDGDPPKEVGDTPSVTPATASASSQQEFLQEATKVLKFMRLAKLTGDGDGKCLVDGGATTSMRRASSEDEIRGLPRRTVKLAVGETYFYVNEAGTLLTLDRVAPILAMVDLMEVGCRVTWTSSEGCKVWHPRLGWLPVRMVDGCPEVDRGLGLELIEEAEGVKRNRAEAEIYVRELRAHVDNVDFSEQGRKVVDSLPNGTNEAYKWLARMFRPDAGVIGIPIAHVFLRVARMLHQEGRAHLPPSARLHLGKQL